MVGASDAHFALLKPVLACFAENVIHVGGPGAGHTIKLLNNFIAQAICTATAEASATGQRAGVDLKKLVELVSAGAVNSRLVPGNGNNARRRHEQAEVRARQRAQGPALLHAPGRVAERAEHRRRGGAPVALAIASALGHGAKHVPALVEAQEQLTRAKIIPR
ncbi:MAG: NAD-binding protein [Pseudomonadota bacterium]